MPFLSPMTTPSTWITPHWLLPSKTIQAVMTNRQGFDDTVGLMQDKPYGGFNLGDHVGDDPAMVALHRSQLAASLAGDVCWLKQVHGNQVVRLSKSQAHALPVEADGSFTTEPGLVCAVMVADCIPVLLVAPEGRGVAALHAGWRGLLGAGHGMFGKGIIHTGVESLCEATSCEPADLQAWLGPCIGPQAFEVGQDVRQAALDNLCSNLPHSVDVHFRPHPSLGNKWLADLPGLARDQLTNQGVVKTTGGQWCTASNTDVFFSFRREGITGRQAACISITQR